MSRQSIKEEIKQTRPFRSRSQEAVLALLRTAHLLRRRFEAITEQEGITSQQYNVLRILRGAKAPLPTMEISSRMIETSCGITRLITTLEEKGFVRREQWEGDRRHMLCQITPSGLRVLERLDEAMDAIDDAAAGTVDDTTLDLFIATLSEIRHGVSSEEK
jgi:MarR family transcriptional regulator, organic hydroperoxide resistance regulator